VEVNELLLLLLLLLPPLPRAASRVCHSFSRHGSTENTSRVTRHLSHATCHTPLVTRHTRQLKPSAIICINPAKASLEVLRFNIMGFRPPGQQRAGAEVEQAFVHAAAGVAEAAGP